jgi:hypothetical protein
MGTVNKLRNELIEKILTINNEDFLVALDKFISQSATESQVISLTATQKKMLEMSEDDIRNGRLISQEAMDKRNLEWLNGQ